MFFLLVLVLLTVPVWGTFHGLIQKPPHQQSVIRTGIGAGMVATAIYIFPNIGRISDGATMGGILLLAVAVLAVTGGLWFFVHLGRTRFGDREILGAVWSATQAAIAGAILYEAGLSPVLKAGDSAFLEVMLRAVLIWWLVVSAVKFILYARQPRREGLAEVAAQRA